VVEAARNQDLSHDWDDEEPEGEPYLEDSKRCEEPSFITNIPLEGNVPFLVGFGIARHS